MSNSNTLSLHTNTVLYLIKGDEKVFSEADVSLINFSPFL